MPNNVRSLPTRRNILRVGAVGAAAAVAGASYALLSNARNRRRNIILIVSDAMRADMLGCLGYHRSVNGLRTSITPFIDSLAEQGVLFERAVAPSSWTPLSIGAYFYDAPSAAVHYTGGPYGTSLDVETENMSLAERLRTLGYYTMAITANPIIDQDVLRRGFDCFRFFIRKDRVRKIGLEESEIISRGGLTVSGEPTGELLNDELAKLLRRLKKSDKFFLYLHYNDTHEPYTCPRRLGVELGFSIYPEKNITTTSMHRWRHGNRDDIRAECTFQEGLDELRRSYNISGRYTDNRISDLLRALDRAGLLSDSLVIFTSDHGEEFMDGEVPGDADIGHALNLTQPSIAVPLLVWGRGAAPMRVCEPVSSARVIRDCIDCWSQRKADWRGLAQTLSGGEQTGILSYLNFKSFHGISYIEGNRKLYIKLADSKTVSTALAFKLGGPGGIERVQGEVPENEAVRALAKLNSSPVRDHLLGNADMAQLRALGYLN